MCIFSKTEVTELIIADVNLTGARRLAEELRSGESGVKKIQAIQVDADRPETLVEAMRGRDVAASAVGPFYKYERVMVEAALQARVNYVSICDDYDAVQRILPLDERARELGVRVLTGLGWTPGLSNVLARKGADQLDQVDEINVSWAGSSADSAGFAVVLHTMHIFTGLVPSFRDGQGVTLPRYIPGVKTVTLKGGLTEEFLNSLAIAIARLRLTDTPGKKQAIGKIIKGILPWLEKIGKPGVPMSGIRVDIKGMKGGKPQHLVYQAADHMSNLTGVPLAIGVMMMGQGQIERTGVFAPEADGAVDPDAFSAALAQRNIGVQCTQGLQ